MSFFLIFQMISTRGETPKHGPAEPVLISRWNYL